MNPEIGKLSREISQMRKRLEKLQRQERKTPRKAKPRSTKGRGRPPIDGLKIEAAKQLAKEYSIPDVALASGIAMSTLYVYGVKRYKIPRTAKAG